MGDVGDEESRKGVCGFIKDQTERACLWRKWSNAIEPLVGRSRSEIALAFEI